MADEAPQVTVAVAVPGAVVVPVLQVHRTDPSGSDVAGPRPCERLWAPLGSVTVRSQPVSGEVVAAREAVSPRFTGDVTDSIIVPGPAEAVAGWVVVGDDPDFCVPAAPGVAVVGASSDTA